MTHSRVTVVPPFIIAFSFRAGLPLFTSSTFRPRAFAQKKWMKKKKGLRVLPTKAFHMKKTEGLRARPFFPPPPPLLLLILIFFLSSNTVLLARLYKSSPRKSALVRSSVALRVFRTAGNSQSQK